MRANLLWIAAGTLVLGVASCTIAYGQASAKETQVIARALTFLDPAPTGEVEIGILYAKAHPDSVTQAKLTEVLFGNGITVGRLTVHARLVEYSTLPFVQGLAGIFVVGSLHEDTAILAAAATRLHVPVVSTDLACVRQAQCSVGVDSTSGVRIVLSHAACQSAGISFIQAFRILVTEQ